MPPTSMAAMIERITLEADLRDALVAGDLVLRYQPIVDLATGRTLALESLCRWRHWSRGLLGPADFLPLAEETGLIVPLGAWVMTETCRRMAVWRSRLAEADAVLATVNLSAAEVRHPGLVDRAAQALDAAGLPAGRLLVEISEATVGEDDRAPTERNLRALVELGVGLAVDDVGAPRPGARSGLPDPDGWLWSLPVRMLKIDRSVAAGLGHGPGSRAGRALSAALGLAVERGIPAVAKGIETPDQLARFHRLGCGGGQGFLFARPLDPADVAGHLRRTGDAPRPA
ncbi:MAG TPA: EAL domain-containing protein [Acidimicrobiia bacterium]|nr:EAL domain-containing protein [Acidimicrobiia bacterium]